MSTSLETLKTLANDVLTLEANAVTALKSRIDDGFKKSCELILECSGRVVVTGMGKSGHIGGKIAATLASTGTPSFFVHPGEASHGDLGMITAGDVVLAISNSGETDELLTIIPIIKRLGVPLISMTGNRGSSMAKQSDVNLDISVEAEACPLRLAPTSSTTATLALGDTLAVCLLKIRGFTAEDFARSHPGGKLGRRLLLTVSDVMHADADIPQVGPDTLMSDALVEISQKGLGFTTIVDQGTLVGVYTDGDLRRSFENPVDIHSTPIREQMITPCTSIHVNALAVDALNLMEEKGISALPVLSSDEKLVGAINMHDLLRAGVV
ncbi:MAG: KpsF/GutQ family sugar-phosphate isomerase [bacterium]